MSTVVLYCWCHSDSASVVLYSTLNPMENGYIFFKTLLLSLDTLAIILAVFIAFYDITLEWAGEPVLNGEQFLFYYFSIFRLDIMLICIISTKMLENFQTMVTRMK